MTDQPKLLLEGGAAAPEPDQAIAAPHPCATCGAAASLPVYLLVEHSSYETDRRYHFMRTESVVRSSLAPMVISLCARCYARALGSRRRTRAAAFMSLTGIAIASGYFVGAVLGLSTAIVLSLLFGGFAIFAAMGVAMVANMHALNARLRLPPLPGRQLLVLSTERADLDRVLARRKLDSLAIQNEIDRMASGAAEPPTARLIER